MRCSFAVLGMIWIQLGRFVKLTSVTDVKSLVGRLNIELIDVNSSQGTVAWFVSVMIPSVPVRDVIILKQLDKL